MSESPEILRVPCPHCSFLVADEFMMMTLCHHEGLFFIEEDGRKVWSGECERCKEEVSDHSDIGMALEGWYRNTDMARFPYVIIWDEKRIKGSRCSSVR